MERRGQLDKYDNKRLQYQINDQETQKESEIK